MSATPAPGYDDAATLDQAAAATNAGMAWLFANKGAWRSAHYLGDLGLAVLTVAELNSICRDFAAGHAQIIQALNARSRALPSAIRELEAEAEFAAGMRVPIPTGSYGIPHGMTAAEWGHRCREAADTLKALNRQLRARGRAWRAEEPSRADLYFALFVFFADLCGTSVEDLTISSMDGPSAHAMNFILAVTTVLLGKQPTTEAISRSVHRSKVGQA